MIRLFLVLLVGLLALGCASVKAVQETPDRTREWVEDPVRTRYLFGRVIESCVGGASVGLLALPFGPLIGCPAAALIDFLTYEYVLEPYRLVGPYWERGPRLPVISADGTEVVEPGEVFKETPREICLAVKRMWRDDATRPSGGWCE